MTAAPLKSPNFGVEIDAARAKYPTSKNGILQAGLIPAKEGTFPPYVWIDGILTKEEAMDHENHQRFSKIPGMDFICYKSTLFSCLNDIRRYYPAQFDVYPRTFLLPQEFLEFQREHMTLSGKTNSTPTWVVKPRNSCCGNGITIVQSTFEVQQQITEPSVIQLYVKPYLVNQRKFDFRFYILIGSLDPLTVYIYNEGIARFCSEPFQMPSRSNKDQKFMHLTNTAINVENGQVDPAIFTKKSSEVLKEIIASHPKAADLWEKICEACRATIIGVLPKVVSQLPRGKNTSTIYQTIHSDLFRHRKMQKLKDVSEDQPEEELPDLNPKPKPEMGPPTMVNPLISFHIGPKVPTPLLVQTKLSTFRRTVSVSPTKKTKPHFDITMKASNEFPQPPTKPLPNLPEEEEEARPLRPRRRYFHILGIDIIIDSNLEPKVLELNDRPSLSVTVPFEKDLKEGFIRDTFAHVKTNGDCFGDCEGSGWHQIYPLPPDHPNYQIWKEIYAKASHPRINGEIDAPSPSVRIRPSETKIPNGAEKKKKGKSKKKKHPKAEEE